MESSATPLPPDEQPNQPAPPPELSEREVEVLRLVATGAGNKEIAQKLFISPNTVKVHLRNIFTKIGAASRTEAAMYAAREGLVSLPASATMGADGMASPSVEAPPTAQGGAAFPPSQAEQRRQWMRWATIAVLIIAVFGVLVLWTLRSRPTPPPTPTASAAAPRWQHLADMPTARAGLSVAVYDNHIYAIGGENSSGVTGSVDRYSLTSNTWEVLPPMPTPVADASAAVIGGEIYIPGGRLASGAITSTLKMYNPRDQRWVQLAPMPAGLSAYALAAFEGRLYVFGGWNGQRYVNSAYEYNPELDQWKQLPPMPTARGYAGAAVADGRIYVLGGNNSETRLSVNEAFTPDPNSETSPWKTYAPLPIAKSKMGVASLVSIIYLCGGTDISASSAVLAYFAELDEWRTLPSDFSAPVSPGITAQGAFLFALGGQLESAFTSQLLAYQAVYIISIPLVK